VDFWELPFMKINIALIIKAVNARLGVIVSGDYRAEDGPS
jgi:hypothetical protein